MKHYIQLLAAAVLPVIFMMPAAAQDKTQGRIRYTVKINMHEGLKADQQSLKEVIPETVERHTLFTFKQRHAMITEEEVEPEETGAVVFKVNFNDSEKPTYLDMDTKKSYKLFTGGDKSYLVADAVQQKPSGENAITHTVVLNEMKETGKTKKILGYTCKQLELGSGDQKGIAWYTAELPILGSPMGIMTDKGVILEMESRFLSFTAEQISLEKVADSEVMPPAGTLTVTKAEYDKIKSK